MEVVIAQKKHTIYSEIISKTITEAAKVRGTGIAKRTPEYIQQKIESGNAIIALEDDEFAGFCYIESWSHGKFVANSGLIVHPKFRGMGLAKKIKKAVFDLSRKKYPSAKIFSITTGLAVMKMNSDLGYKPVTFSELTDDQSFWKGCQTCKNYDVLQRTNQKMCLCTGMLYDATQSTKKSKPIKQQVVKRLNRIKESLFLKKNKK